MGVLRVSSIAMLLAALLAGCGSSREESKPMRGDFTLEGAQAFEEFPLFYAGEEVDGLPLVAILRRSDTANYVSFIYGECVPTSYDGGCAPPAEIQVWPGEARNLGSYDTSLPGTPQPDETRIRGLPAAIFDDGTQLEIYAPHSTIVIFSHTSVRALEIARLLRCVRPAASATTERPADGLAC
jgi:hypothetical protein